MVIMVPFLWMPHLAQMTWNSIYSPWWDLIKWLKPLKDKVLSHMSHWKPSHFLVDDALQELKALWLVLYLIPTLYLFPYMFFDIFHKIFDYFKCILCCTNPIHSWRFYCMSLLGSYGVWTRFPSTFVVGMFSKHGAYVILKKSKMWKCGVESSKTFMMWCTCPSIMEKQLMTSKTVGRLLWEKAFINIGLVMRGQIISGLITINLVTDNIYRGLVFKIVL